MIEIYPMLVCYITDLNMNGPFSSTKATSDFKKFVVQLYLLSDHRVVICRFQTKPSIVGYQATELLSKNILGACLHFGHYLLLSGDGV